MAKAKKTDPSVNEVMMPKGMGEEARKMLEQGKKEMRKPKSFMDSDADGMKKGGKVKKYARGGGIESKGKTRGKFV